MRKGRKISGGKYHKPRKKKSYEAPGQNRSVKIGERNSKTKRVLGGNKKTVLFNIKFINVVENGKTKKAEIKNVLETPSNRFLARQNIMTKGTIIETSLGKVKITNRPGQEGVTNGILVKSE